MLGMVVGAEVVAPNVVMGNVEATGVVGGPVVVRSERGHGYIKVRFVQFSVR